ncbi:MAG: sigma-70 family RNA polymerase sigma factor [Myxococcaceae bacterium]
MATTDQELIAAARAGDTRAMEQLLGKYEARVYRFGLRMCGNEDDARDILQETLLAAFKGLASFRGDSQVSTWLFQVARSFCIKHHRRREGEPAKFEELDQKSAQRVAIDTSQPDSRTHARQVGEVIEAAMRTLSDDYREALVLRDVEGLSAEEAAEVAGIEVGALKSRLHRARMQLKQSLSAVLDDEQGEIGCPDLQAELSAYASSDIDQAACERIEKHLASCSQCTAACESLKRTVSMCRALPGGDVPASVKAAVRHALRFN